VEALSATAGPGVPALSIVSTMFRSRPYLEAFVDECLAALAGCGIASFEIVLVNDGSPDDSLAWALARRAGEPRIVIVDLSRNFGHHPAMHAGLAHARGERVFLIDCDLEVRPAVLARFVERQRETGADLVFGYQEARKGGWFEQWSGGLFWRALNAVSEVRIPENMLTERLMTRRFVDALLRLGDHNLFLGGMMSWTGFVQLGMPLAKGQREGRSTYSLRRRLQLMVTAISSFSPRPLAWLFNVGVVITLASFAYAAWLVLRKLLLDDALVGFTSLMALLALTLGVLTTGLGLVGIYLGKVFAQVQNRPPYIVRELHR
jgi:putative glycosyltransferase